MTEVDLGVPINLIDPAVYGQSDLPYQLHPRDEELLEEEAPAPAESKRARQHAKTISWLRKTEYISSEYARTTHIGAESSENRIGLGRGRDRLPLHMDMYKDKQSQISAVEATFEAAREDIKCHYSKPGVEPEWVLPLFPDFTNWKLACTHVIFDSHPATQTQGGQETDIASGAIMRAMTDERDNEEYIAYFQPTPECVDRRRRDEQGERNYTEGQEYVYRLEREYSWNFLNKVKGYEDSFFFVVRDGCVFYNELNSRIKLNKRRGRGKPEVLSSMCVRHRELTEEEGNRQDLRLMQLDTALDEADMDEGSEECAVEREGDKKEREAGGSSDNHFSLSPSDDGDDGDDGDGN